MGILVMNVVSFGLPDSAYMNHLSYGVENLLDWIVIVISAVFFDSKMMGLFSALFGAGMVIFYERAKGKTSKLHKRYRTYGNIGDECRFIWIT